MPGNPTAIRNRQASLEPNRKRTLEEIKEQDIKNSEDAWEILKIEGAARDEQEAYDEIFGTGPKESYKTAPPGGWIGKLSEPKTPLAKKVRAILGDYDPTLAPGQVQSTTQMLLDAFEFWNRGDTWMPTGTAMDALKGAGGQFIDLGDSAAPLSLLIPGGPLFKTASWVSKTFPKVPRVVELAANMKKATQLPGGGGPTGKAIRDVLTGGQRKPQTPRWWRRLDPRVRGEIKRSGLAFVEGDPQHPAEAKLGSRTNPSTGFTKEELESLVDQGSAQALLEGLTSSMTSPRGR